MEFKDRFDANPKRSSVTQIGEHQIDVLPTARPVKAKHFRMYPQQEEEVNRQALEEEMIRNGIARPSSSPWGSNFILVRKRDGSTKFVVDYHQRNDLTIKDSYPVPNVRDVVDKMSGSLFFSKMDMARTYWAVPFREENREKAAFMTPGICLKCA